VCFNILENWDFGFVHQVLTFTRRHNESLTSFTNGFNTRRLANFMILLKYGPTYLGNEHEKRLEQEAESYYRFLARSVFGLKGREFWNFHGHELKKLGHPLKATRLIRALFFELWDFREATRQVRQAIRQKKEQKTPEGASKFQAVLSSIYNRES